jgi:Na+-transporting methylmalonyl-CoA/oxaloacetate decarboxylase gamma subunit
MYGEAIRVAGVGFSVVFITLILLAMSVKIMSFFCRGIGRSRRGAKK